MRKLVTIVLFLMFISGISSQNFNVDGIQYVIISQTNAAEVSYGGDYRNDIVIPPTVSYLGLTYPVNSIGMGAFTSSWQLTSVVIPGSVEVIHTLAFYKCIGLKQVNITQAIDSIGNNAFENCTSLTSFALPFASNGTKIGNNAFFNCNKMTSISLPNSIASLGSGAFAYCSSLVSFDIPSGISSIPENTFDWCSSLQSITIPSNIITINRNAFGDCTSLKSVTLPNSITTIGPNAFYKCSSLSAISIPASVTTIGVEAFAFCTNLNVVNALSSKPIAITSDCFQSVPYSSVLNVPNNSEIDYKLATGWKEFFTVKGSSTIFNYEGVYYRTVSANEVEVFSRNENYALMMPLTIPVAPSYDGQIYKVVAIREMAFSNWNGLTDISLPNTITSIGNQAFINCPNLKTLNTPEALMHIGNNAFMACTNFQHLYIPASTKTIDDYALNSCTSMDQIWINVKNPSDLTLGFDIFNGIPVSDCKVFVPKGSANLYKTAAQWKLFCNILPQPAPRLRAAYANYDNFVEFDYDAYFMKYSDFDISNAFGFYLTSVSPNVASSKIGIYPTLVKDALNITGIETSTTVEVTDMRGVVLLTRTIEENTVLSLGSLPKAVYYVKIKSLNTSYNAKIVKD